MGWAASIAPSPIFCLQRSLRSLALAGERRVSLALKPVRAPSYIKAGKSLGPMVLARVVGEALSCTEEQKISSYRQRAKEHHCQ